MIGFLEAHPWWPTLIGFVVALGVGHVLVKVVRRFINRNATECLDDVAPAVVPSWIVGLGERIFFATAVAFLPPNGMAGILPAMMLWVAAKLAANWEQHKSGTRKVRGKSIRAVALGVTSLGTALIGGLIARWGFYHLGLTYLK